MLRKPSTYARLCVLSALCFLASLVHVHSSSPVFTAPGTVHPTLLAFMLACVIMTVGVILALAAAALFICALAGVFD